MPAPATVVLFAKAPRLGAVKTRLTRGAGALEPEQALAVHEALLRCALIRLFALAARRGAEMLLALDDVEAELPQAANNWPRVEQGGGDLGARLARVGERLPGPYAFFGVDCPDVPADTLTRALDVGAEEHALGPVDDGGYWTLAGPRFDARLVTGIAWDAADVAAQTRRAAAAAGLTLRGLPAWHDVDHPADLAALRARLVSATAPDPDDPALATLAGRLDAVASGPPQALRN